MEININCISNELNIIMNKHKDYNSKIILYVLAAQELIIIIKKTHMVPFAFLKIMRHLRNYVNCYIDFDFLFYVSHNNKKITWCDKFKLLSSDNSADIYDMLQKDSELLNNIIDNNIYGDEYGTIDKDVIDISKRLFNIMDRDKDGYINALDVLYISNICEKYVLVFENNFIDIMIETLINHKFIDFYMFFKHLF